MIVRDVRRNRNTLRLTYATQGLTMLTLVGLFAGIASWGIFAVVQRDGGTDRIQILQLLFMGGNSLVGVVALRMLARLRDLNAAWMREEKRFTWAAGEILMCRTRGEMRRALKSYASDQAPMAKPRIKVRRDPANDAGLGGCEAPGQSAAR